MDMEKRLTEYRAMELIDQGWFLEEDELSHGGTRVWYLRNEYCDVAHGVLRGPESSEVCNIVGPNFHAWDVLAEMRNDLWRRMGSALNADFPIAE